MRSPALFAALLAAGSLLTACDRSSSAPSAREDDPMLLRQYPAPPDRSEAVANALNDVLAGSEKEPGVGRASSRVAGQVVVLAPASMQTSIAKTIESLVGNEPASGTPNAAVRVHYWFVDAVPGEGTDDAGLTDIDAALSALEASLGPVHFRLVDRVSLVSGSRRGSSETQSGRGTLVMQQLESGRDGLRAELRIRQFGRLKGNITELGTQVGLSLNLDETVLLSMANANEGDDRTQRLILLRAESIGTP